MSYTVTPYDDYKSDRIQIDAGACQLHPERDRDIVMQTILIVQPATKAKILSRVNNHNINGAMLACILSDLVADDLIKKTDKPHNGKRKKIESFYTLALKSK